MTNSRYEVTRIYVVVCKDCNEDISRPVTSEDLFTRAEMNELVREHERTFHGHDQH